MVSRGHAFYKGFATVAAIMIGLVLVAGSVYPKVRGWEPLVVLTQSMEPLLHPGDVVVVEPVSGRDVAVGDVVTYRAADSSLITHRVVEVRRSTYAGREDTVIVQGDANNVPDDPLVASQVVGRMLYRMPGYGVFMSMPVKVGLLGVVTLLLLVDSVWSSRVQAREKNVEANTVPVVSNSVAAVASATPGDTWTESNTSPGDTWTESNTPTGDTWTVSAGASDGWATPDTTPGDGWTVSDTEPSDAWATPAGAWN